jgi:hypothetical protein
MKALTYPFTVIIISLGIQTSTNHFKDAILLSQPILSSAALQVKTFAIKNTVNNLALFKSHPFALKLA